MKKITFFALLMALVLSGCSSRVVDIKMQENWIHYDNIEFVMQNKSKDALLEELGSPVLVKLKQDTVFYIYNYRIALYEAERNIVKKPQDKDKLEMWLPASRMYAFKVVDNKVVEGTFYDAEPQAAPQRNSNGGSSNDSEDNSDGTMILSPAQKIIGVSIAAGAILLTVIGAATASSTSK